MATILTLKCELFENGESGPECSVLLGATSAHFGQPLGPHVVEQYLINCRLVMLVVHPEPLEHRPVDTKGDLVFDRAIELAALGLGPLLWSRFWNVRDVDVFIGHALGGAQSFFNLLLTFLARKLVAPDQLPFAQR